MKAFDGNDTTIITMYNEGNSAGKIAHFLSVDKSTVLRRLKKNNIQRRATKQKIHEEIHDKSEEIIKNFNSGTAINKISEQTGYSHRAIRKLLRKNGFDTIRNLHTYSVDETFFEKIDTWKKAYILGWLYSDGCVMENGVITINLNAKDVKILEDIKTEMQYTGPLSFTEANNNINAKATLCIARVKMMKDLLNLGCLHSKSLILKFPTEEQVPKHLLSAFILGYFDGNGCVRVVNNTILYANITSTEDFCKSVKEYLKEFEIYPTNIYVSPNGITSSLMFGRQVDSIKFLNHIYKDHEMHLERKYNKYLEINAN